MATQRSEDIRPHVEPLCEGLFILLNPSESMREQIMDIMELSFLTGQAVLLRQQLDRIGHQRELNRQKEQANANSEG